ncbi:hypothetical protein HaLaN_25123, partial [Haematococcus lacustris]
MFGVNERYSKHREALPPVNFRCGTSTSVTTDMPLSHRHGHNAHRCHSCHRCVLRKERNHYHGRTTHVADEVLSAGLSVQMQCLDTPSNYFRQPGPSAE